MQNRSSAEQTRGQKVNFSWPFPLKGAVSGPFISPVVVFFELIQGEKTPVNGFRPFFFPGSLAPELDRIKRNPI